MYPIQSRVFLKGNKIADKQKFRTNNLTESVNCLLGFAIVGTSLRSDSRCMIGQNLFPSGAMIRFDSTRFDSKRRDGTVSLALLQYSLCVSLSRSFTRRHQSGKILRVSRDRTFGKIYRLSIISSILCLKISFKRVILKLQFLTIILFFLFLFIIKIG